MDYEKDTKLAYRNVLRAKEYKKHLTQDFSWARITTFRERQCVHDALKQCKLKPQNIVLDIPCGTGIIDDILGRFPSRVVSCDISKEMMHLANVHSREPKFYGFIQADITCVPYVSKTFKCVITLGFMHRVPPAIRRKALREIAAISSKFIIVSYAIDTKFQKMKKWAMGKMFSNYIPAPSPSLSQEIIEEFNSQGLTVKKKYNIVSFLSADVIFLLEKKNMI